MLSYQLLDRVPAWRMNSPPRPLRGKNNLKNKTGEYWKHRQAKQVQPVSQVTRLEAGVLTLSFEEAAPDGCLIKNRHN